MKSLLTAISSLLLASVLTPVMAQSSEAEKFDLTKKLDGGWVLKCLSNKDKSGKEVENCLIDQTFKKDMPEKGADGKATGKSNKVDVLKVTIGGFDGGKAMAIVAAPPGVALIPGMEVVVDGKKLQASKQEKDGKSKLIDIEGLSYERCIPTGCITALPLSDESILGALKKGTTMTVSFYPTPDPKSKIDVDVSLKGFTAAFEATLKK